MKTSGNSAVKQALVFSELSVGFSRRNIILAERTQSAPTRLRNCATRCVQAKEHMDKNHDILTYVKLAEGARFFLDESFKYVNQALTSEAAGKIFSKLINEIEPTEIDNKMINGKAIPDTPIELLQSAELDILSNETISKFQIAWERANLIARTEKYTFKNDHKVDSIDLLGHLNNLGFFIETLTNRHLLFMNQNGLLDNPNYSKISKARIMERLNIVFAKDFKKNKVDLKISTLFKLRNKTVHYTPDNAIELKPMISELLSIWEACKKLCEMFEDREKFNEDLFSESIIYYMNNFNAKWISQ